MRAAAALLLVAAACKGNEAPRPASGTPARGDAGAQVEGPRRAPADRPPGPNQVDREDAGALLEAWLAAQVGGDFPGYQKLYADRFTGVRRSGAKVRRFDRAGWMEDRGRMFQKPMSVTADAIQVIAHGAQTHLFFTQTFEQGTYRDTGRKWMALERGTDGRFRIAREEMLDSTLIARQEKDLAAARAVPEPKELASGEVDLGWAARRDKVY
ncbi:MAG TPA: nuclear transport factor 2 family protein, partial [Kofleriaceae bacterium]|nr:nuclear transport factor 2 family protein [Kofleriaceae bacterium]